MVMAIAVLDQILRVRIGLGASGGELGKVRGKVRGGKKGKSGQGVNPVTGKFPGFPPPQFAP